MLQLDILAEGYAREISEIHSQGKVTAAICSIEFRRLNLKKRHHMSHRHEFV